VDNDRIIQLDAGCLFDFPPHGRLDPFEISFTLRNAVLRPS